MKHTRRILCALLTLCMVIGAIPTLYFATAAEEAEEINLASEYAKSMIMITRGDKADGLEHFTDGVIDDTDAGYYTLGGGEGYWCDDDGNALPIEENPAVVQVDLGVCTKITAINVGFLTPGECYEGDRYYHWEAYASNNKVLPISEWTKIAEKKNNEVADEDGCKITVDTSEEYRFVRIYGVYNSAIENDGWKSGFIHVNEVEIWGPEPVDMSNTVQTTSEKNNIMHTGSATVRKSDRDVTYELTNGITDIDYYDDYWSSQSPTEDSVGDNVSWYEVDLGGMYSVDAFTVIERLTKGSSYELNEYYTNWEVYATLDAQAPISEWTKVGEKKNEIAVSEDGYTVEFEQPVVARYLRVYCTKTTSSVDSRFQLSEIQVWTGMKSSVKFEGHQLGLDGTSVRLVGSVNNPDLASVAMKVEVASANKSILCEDTKVCKTLLATDASGATVNAVTTKDSGVQALYTADGDYLFGFSIVGIDAGEYVFTITPIATMADGTVYQGETVNVNITIPG